MNARADRFPLMDSLRAIAVIAVVLTHSSYFVQQTGTSTLVHLRFDMGVTIFFVISGFLIYRPWVHARLRGEPSPLVRVYAWRRLLRIVPAYWVALTVVTLAIGLTGLFTWSGAAVYYGFLQVYFPSRVAGGLTQAWSLCIEVGFYILVPLYALAMARLRGATPAARLRQELIGAGALFAFSAAFKVAAVLAGTLDKSSVSNLQVYPVAQLDFFVIGMVLAALSAWYQDRDELPGPLRLVDRRPWLPWLVAAAAFALVSYGIGVTGSLSEHFTGAQYLMRHYLYALTAAALVLPAMFGDFTRGWVRRVLANRVLLYVGLISYGIFLYHFAVLTQLDRWGFGGVVEGRWAPLWVVAALAGSVLLATLSYYVIERPFLDLKRLVPDPRWRAERGEAIEEPVPPAPPHVQASAP
jgi:peptidoglycan/LPS O-acetylase OafA/YrhL